MSGEWEREGNGTAFDDVDGTLTDAGYENGDRGRDRDWERDEPRRSQSPRSRSPRRERSPRRYIPSLYRSNDISDDRGEKGGSGSDNPGSNLFVSGIAPRLTSDEVEELFKKYGDVVKVQVMLDPHTKESRGFGFVQMATPEEAEAAKEGVTGEERYGRVLTVEKARRGRASMFPFVFCH